MRKTSKIQDSKKRRFTRFSPRLTVSACLRVSFSLWILDSTPYLTMYPFKFLSFLNFSRIFRASFSFLYGPILTRYQVPLSPRSAT